MTEPVFRKLLWLEEGRELSGGPSPGAVGTIGAGAPGKADDGTGTGVPGKSLAKFSNVSLAASVRLEISACMK